MQYISIRTAARCCEYGLDVLLLLVAALSSLFHRILVVVVDVKKGDSIWLRLVNIIK